MVDKVDDISQPRTQTREKVTALAESQEVARHKKAGSCETTGNGEKLNARTRSHSESGERLIASGSKLVVQSLRWNDLRKAIRISVWSYAIRNLRMPKAIANQQDGRPKVIPEGRRLTLVHTSVAA